MYLNMEFAYCILLTALVYKEHSDRTLTFDVRLTPEEVHGL